MSYSMTAARLRRPARLVAGLIVAAGLATAAQADPQIQVRGAAAQGLETQSRLLRFGDLDLASAQGRDRLENRLKVAAGTVCGKRSLWTVRPPADYGRCYDRALTDARIQIDQRLAAGETAIRVVGS
ncbi:UrcA family protein [Sphingomonas profundi]|uniref:UrcA family protein n=1 Tax=Alterirhizorhabdus profundi TaxID=2681549 RepID=UPI0018D1E783|nr:UrcA family protein [Sphingomonas profundi]